MQNLGILRTWGIFRIPWISRIQFTQNFLLPCHLRKRGIYQNPIKYLYWSVLFRTLRNLVIFRTMACSEPEEYLESCQSSMMQHFLRALCNPGIFRTLVYEKPEELSELCQTSIWCSVFLMKPDIFSTLIYSES